MPTKAALAAVACLQHTSSIPHICGRNQPWGKTILWTNFAALFSFVDVMHSNQDVANCFPHKCRLKVTWELLMWHGTRTLAHQVTDRTSTKS
jgi:hypothetical protein